MRTLLFAMLALLTIAPLAVAQESNETPARPDSDGSADPSSPSQAPADAAWVEDCPPDMMCAASADDKAPEEDAGDGRVYKDGEPVPYGDESCIECSGPSDAPKDDGAEPGQALGPEDCIDCMRPPQEEPANGGTCMDGQQESEVCDPDVQYLGGPTRGPEDGSCENCRGEESGPINSHAPAEGDGGTTSVQDEEAKAVPAAGLGVILAAFAVAIALVVRKL